MSGIQWFGGPPQRGIKWNTSPNDWHKKITGSHQIDGLAAASAVLDMDLMRDRCLNHLPEKQTVVSSHSEYKDRAEAWYAYQKAPRGSTEEAEALKAYHEL